MSDAIVQKEACAALSMIVKYGGADRATGKLFCSLCVYA